MALAPRPVVSGVHYSAGDPMPIGNLVRTEGVSPNVVSLLQARGLGNFRDEPRSMDEVLWEVAGSSLEASGSLITDIDGIIMVNSPIDEELLIKTLNVAGFERSWLLGLNYQDCGGCEAAMRLASDLVLGNGRSKKILVLLYGKVGAGESRIGWNGETVFSDGAASFVVSQIGQGYEILASEVVTNPKLSWFRETGAQAKYLEECLSSLGNIGKMVLQSAAVGVRDISKVFATNGSRSYHNIIASALGVSNKIMHGEDLGEFGHVFSCDGLIGLQNHVSVVPATPGEHFMLVSWSPYVLGATILRKN